MGGVSTHTVLVGQPEWKTQEDNIQMGIKQLSLEGDYWINLV